MSSSPITTGSNSMEEINNNVKNIIVKWLDLQPPSEKKERPITPKKPVEPVVEPVVKPAQPEPEQTEPQTLDATIINNESSQEQLVPPNKELQVETPEQLQDKSLIDTPVDNDDKNVEKDVGIQNSEVTPEENPTPETTGNNNNATTDIALTSNGSIASLNSLELDIIEPTILEGELVFVESPTVLPGEVVQPPPEPSPESLLPPPVVVPTEVVNPSNTMPPPIEKPDISRVLNAELVSKETPVVPPESTPTIIDGTVESTTATPPTVESKPTTSGVLEAELVHTKPTILEGDLNTLKSTNPTILDGQIVSIPKPIEKPTTSGVLEAELVPTKPTILEAELVTTKSTVLEAELVNTKSTILEAELVTTKPTVLEAELVTPKPTKSTVLEAELVIQPKEIFVPEESDYLNAITYIDYIDESGKTPKNTQQVQLYIRPYTYRIVMENEDRTEFVLTETNGINDTADFRNGKQVSHILFVKVKDTAQLKKDSTNTLEISFLFQQSSEKKTYGVAPKPIVNDVNYAGLVDYDVQAMVVIPPFINGDSEANQKRRELIHQNNTRLSIDDIDEIEKMYPDPPENSGFVITKIEDMKQLYDADARVFEDLCKRSSLDVNIFKRFTAEFIRKYLETVSLPKRKSNNTPENTNINTDTIQATVSSLTSGRRE